MLWNWTRYAACDGEDTEKFFDKYLKDEEVAIEVGAICASCPVRVECFNTGIDTKSTGIWGGHWLQGGRVIRQKELILNEYFDE